MSFSSDDRTHDIDAARIIFFWLALHGGDLARKLDVPQAIASLAQCLNQAQLEIPSVSADDADFDGFGVVVTERANEEALSVTLQPIEADAHQSEIPIVKYCFKFQGVTIFTELPDLTHLRTAA